MTEPVAFRMLRRRILKVSLIIGTVIAALAFIMATILAVLPAIGLVSVLMAGNWSVNDATNIHFVLVQLTHLTFPPAILFGIIGAWRSFSLNQERATWMLLLSPLLWVLALYLLY